MFDEIIYKIKDKKCPKPKDWAKSYNEWKKKHK